MLTDDRNFYKDLVPIEDFEQVTDSSRHTHVPTDWLIVVADVAGSTREISNGRYKEVNMIGGACIAAVINIDRSIEIPFVFGGDGATFAIPPSLKDSVTKALASTKKMAKDSFAMELRIGMVEVSRIDTNKYWLRLAKFRMSPYVFQAAFSGRGWTEVERLAKEHQHEFGIQESHTVEDADFTGLECRWKSIAAVLDCKVALIIACTDSNSENHSKFYSRILKEIRDIFGEDRECHPVQESLLSLSPTWKVIGNEVKVRRSGMRDLWKFSYYLKVATLCLLGNYLMKRKKEFAGIQWGNYLSDFVNNTDYRKFDGMLRMVIDGSKNQKELLQTRLEELFQAGELIYGIHASPEAIVTCLVSSYNGYHTHFVDGSDGGYAIAAIQLKEQIQKRFKRSA